MAPPIDHRGGSAQRVPLKPARSAGAGEQLIDKDPRSRSPATYSC